MRAGAAALEASEEGERVAKGLAAISEPVRWAPIRRLAWGDKAFGASHGARGAWGQHGIRHPARATRAQGVPSLPRRQNRAALETAFIPPPGARSSRTPATRRPKRRRRRAAPRAATSSPSCATPRGSTRTRRGRSSRRRSRRRRSLWRCARAGARGRDCSAAPAIAGPPRVARARARACVGVCLQSLTSERLASNPPNPTPTSTGRRRGGEGAV